MSVRQVLLRVRALLQPYRVERDLDDELAFHVECETQKLVAQGIEQTDAARQARARFGSRTAVADDCRDVRGIGGVETLLRDLAYAWRTFRRAPLPALTIVVTMTLGLGVATTAFSVFNAVFLRVDAVDKPQELFTVRRPVNSRAWIPFTTGDYDAFSRETDVFTGTAALTGEIAGRLDGRLVKVRLVSGNFFPVTEDGTDCSVATPELSGGAFASTAPMPRLSGSCPTGSSGWRPCLRTSGALWRRTRSSYRRRPATTLTASWRWWVG
jgi:hypothetical protein